MASVDVSEKRPVAVLTASYSGIGTELSKRLAATGYDLIIMNRSSERTALQLKELREFAPWSTIYPVYADLSDHAQLREAAKQIADQHGPIDLLIHNAGVANERLHLSLQGNDVHFEVNTFAPYLLTELLRPLLAAAEHPIVVAVGSSAMRMVRSLNPQELRLPENFQRFKPYAHTKLAIAAAFQAMADCYAKDGISLRIADPGPTRTAMSLSGAMPWWFPLIRWYFVNPLQGSERIYQAIATPAGVGRDALYFEFGRPATLPKTARDAAVSSELLAMLQKQRDMN